MAGGKWGGKGGGGRGREGEGGGEEGKKWGGVDKQGAICRRRPAGGERDLESVFCLIGSVSSRPFNLPQAPKPTRNRRFCHLSAPLPCFRPRRPIPRFLLQSAISSNRRLFYPLPRCPITLYTRPEPKFQKKMSQGPKIGPRLTSSRLFRQRCRPATNRPPAQSRSSRSDRINSRRSSGVRRSSR